MNTLGTLFRITTFGESHGPALGTVIDGCPAGVPLERELIQAALDRRRPGQSSITTARAEPDQVEILSGVFEGKTLGTPLAAIVRNTNQRSGDYDKLKSEDRPGHADAVWRERFKHRDHRGGGRTSGRETLCRVIGGAVAEAYLAQAFPSIRTVAWVSQVGNLVSAVPEPGLTRAMVDAHPTRCPDPAAREEMSRRILTAKEAGDSLGGSIDVRVEGLPVGLGEPIFGKIKALLAHALGSVGAVTGVVWGPPDLLARIEQPGSVFHSQKDTYGGIQGGLANGEPVALRVFFKPPATLADHAKGGRHDPCIMPRAVPVLEAMVSVVLADLVLQLNARPHSA
ncbi:chorismate synthase [Archangium violaceum]|uniref:chorismate synthase n=1 Tax=Archangium violaceum TaxID=83451 RepID=UPI0019512F71|nr:chorismate synthase [Archangium violaceum]QRO01924.1 chorismate synthase [Archangium violaceum]